MEVAGRERIGIPADARLALTSFVASRHAVESCRENGLPLTPNSVAILGQAQVLKSLSRSHDHLCLFLDCIRGKGERIIVASERYDLSLANLRTSSSSSGPPDMQEGSGPTPKLLLKVFRETLSALAFLEAAGLVVVNLRPANVQLARDPRGPSADEQVKVKLFDFGLGHMTGYGDFVSFPVFVDPATTAPEIFLKAPPTSATASASAAGDATGEGTEPSSDSAGPRPDGDSIVCIEPAPKPRYEANCSVWSLGIILASLALRLPGAKPWPDLNTAQTIRKVASLAGIGTTPPVLQRIAREHGCPPEQVASIPDELLAAITACLVPDASARPSPVQLLRTFFDKEGLSTASPTLFPTSSLRCRNLDLPEEEDDDAEPDVLDVLTVQEVFYLWQLAGGDPVGELRKRGLIVNRPPILGGLSPVITVDGHAQGRSKEKNCLHDPDSVVDLNLTQLAACLAPLTADDLYPVLEEDSGPGESNSAGEGGGAAPDGEAASQGPPAEHLEETANLPLVIRERDVRYQCRRALLYRRLLQSYPYLRSAIWREARLDALPLYRGLIWAALLGVSPHDGAEAAYAKVDKESWTPTDRQIEVDIPRCHQYNHLLASPEGHRKFKRILKAWVVTNPQYVYWQGLDSLCAPFLLLNFNQEALAFACLSAFIPKYLPGMFRKDNADVIQEYLAKFQHLQAFHDPVLFNHLNGIGFIPDLYAIPWVLTMFAHVFPLHDIFHLWDKLLLGNSSFPLCVAMAILHQLRDRLLQSEFNDCILLFSDLPAVDIERCVKDSIRIFCTTPRTLAQRNQGSPADNPSGSRHPGGPAVEPAKGGHAREGTQRDLTLDSVTVEQQKREKVGRISGEEVLVLLGLDAAAAAAATTTRQPSGSSSSSAGAKPRLLALDVRPWSEYRVGALPDSVSVPYASVVTGSPPDPQQHHQAASSGHHLKLGKEALDRMATSRGKVICVVGSRHCDQEAVRFAELLLQQHNQARVCVLHNGIETFKPLAGVLIVPNA